MLATAIALQQATQEAVQLIAQFQSLVGFKINWNKRTNKRINRTCRFQSLVGFKINWNLPFLPPHLLLILCFNP